MRRIFVIIPAFIVLFGISGVAFAKHHHQTKDRKADKVPCLVEGVQKMVKSEDACKDLKGTIVTVAAQDSHDKAAGAKKDLTIPADLKDCAKDTLVDKFGDWFGNIGKKKATKEKNIAVRRANRLAACAEKQA